MAAPISSPTRSCRWNDTTASRRRRSSGGSSTSLSRRLRHPVIAAWDPHVSDMAEQVDLASLFSPEPPRHRLRQRVFAVDDVHDLVELKGRERPIDRRPRRLAGVTLAAKLARDAPADLKTRPARRKPRPDTSDRSL